MKMDLETLARIVEERVPIARTTCVPEAFQIVVALTNRPDVEVALLSPYYQTVVRTGSMDDADVDELVDSVKMLSFPII